jgi:glycosyltransferase involved in cell wall biosynthesis/ubiquinone/menaquinone biosynthesis C-methylase UbiE
VDKDSYLNPLPIFVKKGMQKEALKVALLSQEFAKDCNGGVCRYTYDLAHALADLGNEVHVITRSGKDRDYMYRDGKVFVHEIVSETMDFLDLPEDMQIAKKNLSYSYSACLKLLELIDTVDIQIVEAPLWDGEGFVFSLMKPIPLVIRLETPLFKVAEIQRSHITKDLKLVNWMEGEAVKRADKAIAISNNIGTVISTHHAIAQEKIELCPLGIAIPDEGLLLRERKEDGFNILFVGRLEKRKGVETLFKAIPMVLKEVSDTHFYIAGKDTYLAPNGGSYKAFLLENLDRDYHKNVEFIGYVDDNKLKDYYKNCDIFVAPSLYESFGLIYLEAMAWGKPVIGCDAGGIPEIIEDGITGILIPPDNATALAEAIIKLRDDQLRAKMGEKGRLRLENAFSIKKLAENTYNIYKAIINKANGFPRVIYNNTNPYPQKFLELLSTTKGYVLDCGSGDRRLDHDKIVNFDIRYSKGVDVVGDGHTLPFKDDTFDLILSQAVLEHYRQPWLAARELYRVSKNDGILYAEAAFMQPFHGAPYHFFNLTLLGIEELLSDFEKIESGAFGGLSDTIPWIINSTSASKRKDLLKQLIEIIHKLDDFVKPDELKNIASGVYFIGRKTKLYNAA